MRSRQKQSPEECRGAARAISRRRNAQRLAEMKEVTASLRAAGIKHDVRDRVDSATFRQLGTEIPTDDLRDLTGVLLGDPWPNDHRRRREANVVESA
jgi:hypothetical protein